MVLAVAFQVDNPPLRVLAMGSPFHFGAWLLLLLISDYRRLAIAVFLLHSTVVALYLVWVFAANDGTERWVRSLVLAYMDFPIMVLFAVFSPRAPVQIALWFLVGGPIWSGIAVAVAHVYDRLVFRNTNTTHPRADD
jgi:hypothetical protein